MFDEVFDDEREEYDYSTVAEDNINSFSNVVVSRGEEYYEDGKVSEVTKLGDLFVSEVCGTEDYTVRIVINDEETLMSCDCPYEDNCKHEFATLLAIQNGNYTEEELKPFVKENRLTVEELIKKIPAEALKKYLLSDSGLANTDFDLEDLERTFIELIPKQEYDFYYNSLYNSYLLKDDVFNLYDSYYDEIRKYIDAEDYEQAFFIIKAILEVTHDLDLDIVSDYPELGMYLRITYRKSDNQIKKHIEKYIMYLVLHQYYGNCYLEDMIVHIN